jgi:glyoxylase-like metal-dependent hydrolase (beta-lactamase superfamily II)
MNAPIAAFALLALVLCAACGRAPPAAASSPEAAEDFHFIEGGFARGSAPDGNTYVYAAPDGLVVIDTGRSPRHAATIIDHARERGAPVRKIINTHWHLDHTSGNAEIKAAFPGAKVHATDAVEGALQGFLARGAVEGEAILKTEPALSDAARAEIARDVATVRNPAALRPDVIVAGPARVAVNGRELELFVAPYAVTEADLWIYDPATKTALVGDLVTVPAPFFDTACPSGWRAALDAVELQPFDRVAAGHGPLLTRSQYRHWRTAFDNLLDCAGSNDGATCAEKWLADAAPFIKTGETDLARSMIVYYVDEIIRSPEKIAEFCPGR